jgi:hypothetical protein
VRNLPPKQSSEAEFRLPRARGSTSPLGEFYLAAGRAVRDHPR